MKKLLLLLIFLFPVWLLAQNSISGKVFDEKAEPLPYTTVAMLRPHDSTLVYFGITNDAGSFEINRIAKGDYLLQIALVGHQTMYRPLSIPKQNGDFGIIVLKSKAIDLKGTEIIGEQIPILVKKDTIEYNAAAFRTKPDAVAEDLLKKLPGVEVDKSGNIKAMGEDVKNVMVDGKEFFSADPKVATKNLPADAISKVQVYDKKSEAAELAGVDDGSRDKTINLLLKDGKKQAWLGELKAGAGTDEHYAASAKVYRFTKKDQFAALGMLNNINKFGFSFQDYIDFNGGLPAMMGSGSMKLTLNSEDDVPINFGQTVNGLITSGAGGLNYSFDLKKNSRLSASYLGNGSRRKLVQNGITKYFTAEREFTEDERRDEENDNYAQRVNIGWKDKSDSTRTILFNANVGLTQSRQNNISLLKTLEREALQNQLESASTARQQSLKGNGTFSFMQRGRGALKLVSLRANAGFSEGLDNSDRLNVIRYTGSDLLVNDNQYRDLKNSDYNYSASTGTLVRLAEGLYIDPAVRAEVSQNRLNRQQGNNENGAHQNDSLSPDFSRGIFSLVPSFDLRYNIGKTKLVLGSAMQWQQRENRLNDTSRFEAGSLHFLPSFSWELVYKTGHRLNLEYTTSIENPRIELLIPVVDNANPRVLIYGNRELKPETHHALFMNWLLFDQFSQSSVFARIGGSYVKDQVGYSRDITDSLQQIIHMMNTKDGFNVSGTMEFSTPVKWIGMNLHLALDSRWNRGLSVINGEENTTTAFTRGVRLSFDTYKKEKWTLGFGTEISWSDTRYSLQQQYDSHYLTLNYFGSLTWDPTDSWHLGVDADVLSYTSGSFNSKADIPLLSADISYGFLKNHRAALSIEASDLLNKNKGFDRISEMNYSREVRSNTIGRYIIFSFKYRLNKATKSGGGLEINVRKH